MKKVLLFSLLLLIVLFYFFNNRLDFKELIKILNKERNFLIKKNINKEENYQKQKNLYDFHESVSKNINLEIIEPKNNTIVNTQKLKIRGKTNPNIEVLVNEEGLKSNEKGEFETELMIDEGENIITIIASDEKGNYAEKEILVNYETLN